ncbi:MAG: hypothetical protein RLZZ426_816 [Actinomycetota bacterium]|jgi:hypothetical protein
MCGALPAGTQIDPALLATQTLVHGTVTRKGDPVTVGYARLLDSSGEFVAEVPLANGGEFRFYARPATWTVRILTGSQSHDVVVEARDGVNAPTVIDL